VHVIDSALCTTWLFVNTNPSGVNTNPDPVPSLAQELDEIQVPAYDTATIAREENDTTVDTAAVNGITLFTDVNPFFGRLLYTHGLAVDQPLSILRVNYADTTTTSGAHFQIWSPFTIVPQWDFRGQPVAGFFAVPSPAHQSIVTHCTDSVHCVFISWPLGWLAYDRKFFTPISWHGTLVEGKRDGAGTLYRRNRQYDPATGRFTQEDPIGLAGGINLYGFGSGDPLNYSDPLGLRVCFQGRGVLELAAATHIATGTTFDLDTDGCVINVQAAGGKWTEINTEFADLAAAPDLVPVHFRGKGDRKGSRTAAGGISIDRSDFGRPYGTKLRFRDSQGVPHCDTSPGATFTEWSVIAHELGHAFSEWISEDTENAKQINNETAVNWENSYNLSHGKPARSQWCHARE
jgi:RHS repeat-associated protein